jgi:signal peptidase
MEGGDEQTGQDSGQERKKDGKKKGIRLAVIAIVIVAIILFAFLIVPLMGHDGSMVVQSDSMQHSDGGGQSGILDAGDTVYYKNIQGRSDVTTYMEGKRQGYRIYGGYGDIIIYYKNGYRDITPVIHRAILWLEYNGSGQHEINGILYKGSFDIPELRNHDEGPGEDDAWEDLSGNGRWYNLSGTILLKNIGWDKQDVVVNLNLILQNFNLMTISEPHSGFITMGDHNKGHFDQGILMAPDGKVRPVQPEWVLGKVTHLVDM